MISSLLCIATIPLALALQTQPAADSQPTTKLPDKAPSGAFSPPPAPKKNQPAPAGFGSHSAKTKNPPPGPSSASSDLPDPESQTEPGAGEAADATADAPKQEPPQDPTGELQFAESTPHEESDLEWSDAPKTQQELPFAEKTPAPPRLQYAPGQSTSRSVEQKEASSSILRREYNGYQPSPQRVGISFKIGPYLPNVDRGKNDGPYRRVFGEYNERGQIDKAKNELIYWLGAQWQFYRLAGPLSVGLDVGFFQDKAQARLAADPSKTSEADQNRFFILPISALLGYQFTLLADKTYIPLAPYVRAGLNYSVWWTQEGDGNAVKDAQGDKVRGGVMGWQGIAGLALRLDDLSRRTGKSMDMRYGINHVSIFGEVMTSSTGWGQKGNINLGDSTYLGGLLVEF